MDVPDSYYVWLGDETAAIQAHRAAAASERDVLGRPVHPVRQRWFIDPILEDWVEELPGHDDPAVSRARMAMLDRIARRRASTPPTPARVAALLLLLLRACNLAGGRIQEDRRRPDVCAAVTNLRVLIKLHPTNGPNDSHAPLPLGVRAA